MENVNGQLAVASPHGVVTESLYGYQRLLTSDVDGDNDVDLVVSFSSPTASKATVWVENVGGGGEGAFSGQQHVILRGSGLYVVMADYSGDGFPDAFIANASTTVVVMWSVSGGQSFVQQSVVNVTVSMQALFVVDVDNDRLLDVIVTAANDIVTWFRCLSVVSFSGAVLFDGGARTLVQVGVAGVRVMAAIVDVNRDGVVDVVTLTTKNGTLTQWTGAGNATFVNTTIVTKNTRLAGTTSFDVFDCDSDGDLDVVFSNGPNSPHLQWNENNGTFLQPFTYLYLSLQGSAPAFADLTGDGAPEQISVPAIGSSSLYVSLAGSCNPSARCALCVVPGRWWSRCLM